MSKQSKKEEHEQEQVWLEIFQLFDKDKNGHICEAELGHVMRALDMDPTQRELDAAVRELDKDGNGVIEFHDFKCYMQKMKKQSYDERKDEMMRAFRLIDKNNDKFIDSKELMATLTSLGEPLSEAEVNAMINVADVNKDGKIDYEEFVDFILSPCLANNPRSTSSNMSVHSSNNTSFRNTNDNINNNSSNNTTNGSQSVNNNELKSQESNELKSQESLGFFYTGGANNSTPNENDMES